MNNKFRLVMRSVDDDLLEEAMVPVKRKRSRPWIGTVIAASLLLVIGLSIFPVKTPSVTIAELADMGYEMKLPEEAEQIRYELVTLAEGEGAQASFSIGDTDFVYQAVKTQEQHQLSDDGNGKTQLLSWNAGDLDIQLLSSSSSTSVSWYTSENKTQWYLTANADAQKVLTAASQILRITGLDVTVAPENAQNITYNAFLMDGMTVAETSFELDGITYAYRMAGTMELREDFADISGLDCSFRRSISGEVYWCSARLSFDDGGQGKIVWFDLVPGILYSLTMDNGASEDALLDMAGSLYEPAQENS